MFNNLLPNLQKGRLNRIMITPFRRKGANLNQ
jgi:hypothetical protein